MPIALLLRLITSVSIIPGSRQSAEQHRLAAECVVDPVDKEVLPFARVEQERKSSCHNLFLDAELVVTIEQAVMAFQVDAGRVLPFRWCGAHLVFGVSVEESHQDIQAVCVVRIYIVAG